MPVGPMTHIKKRFGFTIVELLVVISIIAVIATLSTGAAIKSIQQARSKRIEATKHSLKLALSNYYAMHGEWPCEFNNPDSGDKTFQTFTGKKNAEVFKQVFMDVLKKRALIDTSTIFTSMPQGRMTVKQALERGMTDIPVGYPDPKNTDKFRYFKIRYNFLTDSINVENE